MNRSHTQQHTDNLMQAKEQGNATYYGPACKYQHSGLRYTSNKACVTCHRMLSRNRYRSKTKPVAVSQQQDKTYQLWHSAKHRARKFNRDFTISKEDIVIPDICPVLGIPMTSPSLDRFDNNKGYTPDNIRVISSRANNLKNDATIDELEKILHYMRS